MGKRLESRSSSEMSESAAAGWIDSEWSRANRCPFHVTPYLFTVSLGISYLRVDKVVYKFDNLQL